MRADARRPAQPDRTGSRSLFGDNLFPVQPQEIPYLVTAGSTAAFWRKIAAKFSLRGHDFAIYPVNCCETGN